MLTQFRGALKGVVAWFIVALMVLAFAFFGVPDLRNFAQSNALVVGKEKFSAVEVQNEFNRQLELRRQSGEQITRQQAIDSGLLTSTLNTMRSRAAITEDARELRLTSTPQMVADFLQSIEGLKNPTTGKFDQVILDQILRQNDLNIMQFRDDVRSDLVRQQIFNSIAAPMNAPEAFVQPLILRSSETRSIEYIVISPEDIPAIPDPSEEDLRSHFEENADAYTDPQYRTFQVVALRQDDFQADLVANEDDLRRLYEVRKSRLDTPETRTVIQIPYSSSTDAEGALARLNTGATWDELAADMSFDIETVTYENIRQVDLADAELSQAIFAAEQDDVIGPVTDLFGNHVIATVLSITPGQETTFEEQREALVTELLEDETTRRLLDAIEVIEVARDEGATISEAITEIEAAVLKPFGPVDADLMTPDGAIVNDLPAEVLREAYTLQLGDESDVVELEDGSGYFMLVVDDIIPPALRPFDTVREDVTTSWRAAETRTAISAAADGLLAQVSGETSLSDIAATESLQLQSVSLSRQTGAPGLPSLLIDDIFLANLGATVSGKSDDQQSAFIATVQDAVFPPLPQAELMQQLYQANLGQLITQELSDAYIRALQQEIGVKQNDAQLAQVFGLGQEQ